VKAVQILISGRVQGVGFRWFAERQAERWRVAGFARNLPDGRVEVRAQAEEQALAGFCEDLRRGPRYARVDGFELTALPVDAALAEFSIRF
jgi:acylphosphatase